MSRNTNSIGYIPPTPFRDDSDIFVLPSDPPAEMEEVFPEQSGSVLENRIGTDEAGTLLQLQSIASLRSELQRRRGEITQRFRDLMNLLPCRGQTAPRNAMNAARTGRTAAASTDGPDDLTSRERHRSGPDRPVDDLLTMEPRAEPDNDRLAALKAQLAARLQLVQGSGHPPAANRATHNEEPQK